MNTSHMNAVSSNTRSGHCLQRGFTVIELLVAVTISLLVISGLSYILAETHKSQRIQAGVQDLQEYGRYAIENLSRDVRGAGYMGCSQGANFTNNLNLAYAGLGLPPKIKGFEFSTTGASRQWYPSDGSDPADPSSEEVALQSDSFVITYASATPFKVGAGTEGSASLDLAIIDPNTGSLVDFVLEEGDIPEESFIYVANCESIDLFQVTDVDLGEGADLPALGHTTTDEVSPGNAADVLGGTYEAGDDILTFSTIRYYVSTDPAITDPQGNLIPTLFVDSTNEPNPVPVVVGVENMQVRYGEDTGGTPAADRYVQADDVASWNNIRTLQVAMLLRSEQSYGVTDAEGGFDTYRVLDFTVDPGDEKIRRRVFTTTIDMRNGY